MNLVDAYQARRSLDYLMGYSLSPLLIRKLPGCKSAGRVQSVALKLITERENEIQKFKPEEYWTIEPNLVLENDKKIEAKLYEVEGEKIKKLSIKNEKQAQELKEEIFSFTDGCVIGSHLKLNGNTWNSVDPDRVLKFMDKVDAIR